MGERGGGGKRGGGGGGAGAPFYAPPRRKTSAEIISEARAAVYGETSATGTGSGGAVRLLCTRRPFTPREPQRTLFTERGARKKDTRPPSSFDLKHLTLSETAEDSLEIMAGRIATLDDDQLNILLAAENQNQKKSQLRSRPKPPQEPPPQTPGILPRTPALPERSSDSSGGFTKLPHLSGRSKPLHRRQKTLPPTEEAKCELELSHAITVTRPLGSHGDSYSGTAPLLNVMSKSLSLDTGSKRRQLASISKQTGTDSAGLHDISVKHLAVQMPHAPANNYSNMSLLELAEALCQKSSDVNRTVLLMESMIPIVEKSTPSTSLKELVLRALFMHVDSESERVLVAVARTLLTMRVTGTQLAAACKLVFKIARNDTNDHFFTNSNLLELLVEGCGRADPLTEGECCVYGAGSLRFLTLDPTLCSLAHKVGALHLVALHLKILNNAKAESPRAVSEQSTHAMYQLTGALRNLAGASHKEMQDFVASGALGELLNALLHHTDRDVLTNVARCLSVLSAEESCCSWLCASSISARALLRALAACGARAPLAVRLAYTLGNMAAADEQARINIYNEEGGVDVLLTILESYSQRNEVDRDTDIDPDIHLLGTDLGGSDGSNEDVLIKTVRVVANLCLAELAGRGLAASYADRTIKALLACLDVAERCTHTLTLADRESGWLEHREELATAALATLNNITFYRDMDNDPMDQTLDQLCRVTCRWLSFGCGAASCEAVRALGNLSRAAAAAQLVVLHGALDELVPFLCHEDASVRCAAAGVLVNVCGAGAENSAAAALAARALSAAAAAGDASAAALLARALWNAHAHSPLSAERAHQAATALAVFIDDESVFAACEATRGGGDRRSSDPTLAKHHVKFELDNNNVPECGVMKQRPFARAYSVDQELNLALDPDDEDQAVCSGEDLGFEEGDLPGEDECECLPCRRLAAWEELVGVAIPLLKELRPPRSDASVGTE